ncbi:MAG: type II toxin-antitoxin system RelE/ParE family toxin [Planctomycetes bacterium]|nr:type II toxin-antitoxin system RelE/ParE family toxin [Planctomycetota bacterium]
MRRLAENFDVITPEPLTGEWQGLFKLRVGPYRAIYAADKEERKIIVHAVKHRREVYKTR